MSAVEGTLTLPGDADAIHPSAAVVSPAVDEHAHWKPQVNPWIIAMTVALAAFMEVLDTSIAKCGATPHRR